MFLLGIILVAWINGGWLLITDYFIFKDDMTEFEQDQMAYNDIMMCGTTITEETVEVDG